MSCIALDVSQWVLTPGHVNLKLPSVLRTAMHVRNMFIREQKYFQNSDDLHNQKVYVDRIKIKEKQQNDFEKRQQRRSGQNNNKEDEGTWHDANAHLFSSSSNKNCSNSNSSSSIHLYIAELNSSSPSIQPCKY